MTDRRHSRHRVREDHDIVRWQLPDRRLCISISACSPPSLDRIVTDTAAGEHCTNGRMPIPSSKAPCSQHSPPRRGRPSLIPVARAPPRRDIHRKHGHLRPRSRSLETRALHSPHGTRRIIPPLTLLKWSSWAPSTTSIPALSLWTCVGVSLWLKAGLVTAGVQACRIQARADSLLLSNARAHKVRYVIRLLSALSL
jgi:hypothetical protein